MRLLHRSWHQGETVEAVVMAAMRAGRLGPGHFDDVEAFGEAVLAFLVGDAIGLIGAWKGAAADPENEAAAADLVQGRGLFGEAQRVTERQYLHRRADLDAAGSGGQ